MFAFNKVMQRLFHLHIGFHVLDQAHSLSALPLPFYHKTHRGFGGNHSSDTPT